MFPGLLLVAGAAAMYLLDPDRGQRRRALMRDQLLSAASHLDDAIEATARDLIQRAQGLVAEARSTVSDEEVSDEILVNRIRAKMGRVVSHPGAIKVTAEQGRVTLSGAVLEHGNVRDVKVREDGGSHWTVTGPRRDVGRMGCGHDQARAESALGLAHRPRGHSGACRDDPI